MDINVVAVYDVMDNISVGYGQVYPYIPTGICCYGE